MLGAAGVEAADGWGLLLGAGCVEGAGLTVLGTGARGVTFEVGASARSNLFSWLVTPGAEGPSGCEAGLAKAGLETLTASSVTWA